MFSGIIAARRSTKRGGEVPHVPLDEVLLEVESNGIEVVALDTALCSLAKIDTRKSRVVELRYFGGLSLEETAEILQVSVETAKRWPGHGYIPDSPASRNYVEPSEPWELLRRGSALTKLVFWTLNGLFGLVVPTTKLLIIMIISIIAVCQRLTLQEL